MNRASKVTVLVAALALAASCGGSSGGTDGGGGGNTGGAGAATGGTGGHGTGGTGGIDNQCISAGQSCGAVGATCCSGLTCCQGNNGQASCVFGSCAGRTGTGGKGGAGSGGSTGSGGQGGAVACFPDGMTCSSPDQCCNRNCNGTCYSQPLVSDRNMKRDFAPVNADEILQAVDALPISTWSYKSDATNARHIGPMAQDFMSTFHVGANDKTILQVDGDGVSLAAIKALSQRVKELEARNRLLEEKISALRTRLPRSRGAVENHLSGETR